MLTAREIVSKQEKVKGKITSELLKTVEGVLEALASDYDDVIEVPLGEEFCTEALEEVCDMLRRKGYKYCLVENSRSRFTEVECSDDMQEVEEFNFYLRISIKNLF